MKKVIILIAVLVIFAVLFLYFNQNKIETVGLAGWRSSEYGYQQEQPPSYWIEAARYFSSKFGYKPAGIWVIGIEENGSCYLEFPGEGNFENIIFSEDDINEYYLDAFDETNMSIWLQVEPANADVETLIGLVLSRYAHHSSVIGFGVDVEWLNAEDFEDGRPVSNEEARSWLEKIKSYNSDYKLFLKHWEIEKMPDAYEGIVFISDSQEFDSYEEMMEEFKDWGNHFSNAEVGFQFGYDSDNKIWNNFEDPFGKIGQDLIQNVPNCRGLYWVDFTITDIFRS